MGAGERTVGLVDGVVSGCMPVCDCMLCAAQPIASNAESALQFDWC